MCDKVFVWNSATFMWERCRLRRGHVGEHSLGLDRGDPGILGPVAAPVLTTERSTKVADYIIWNPASNLPPTRRITGADGGRREAIRVAGGMAGKHGGDFYVCKLVNRASKPKLVEPPVSFVDLERHEDLPF